MKIEKLLRSIGFAALITTALTVIILTACVASNPNKTPDPVTGQLPPPNIIDPRLFSASNTATGIANSLAPVNPYAGVTDYLLKAGFGLAGIVAGYIAQKRNTTAAQAEASQKAVLLNTVIQGVESLGTAAAPVKAAIQTRATAAGVQPALDAAVKANT
jgi:hypothetical protein